MFFGRKSELQKLNALYRQESFQFAVFYGRRRVGKTTLITKFCEDKKTVYFMAAEGTAKENLEYFSKAVWDVFMPEKNMPSFGSFEELLEFLDSCGNEQFVLAIDEYPYLAESYPAISSLLQKHIDHKWKNGKIMLILCGSSMSFMENQVLGYKSPLYGRRTAQFKIQPFTFFEFQEYSMGHNIEDMAVLYGITGGIPEYISRIRPELSLEENIRQLYFDPSGRMFEEPSNLMKQELRNPAVYHSVISAIASGNSRLNDIARKVGEENSACANQLNALISLGLVKKEYPALENETGRKTIYRLEDPSFRFWYRFVGPNISNIMRGRGQEVFQKLVLPQISHYMGEVFENICLQFLYEPRMTEKAPFFYGNIGRWWGNNPVLKRQEEIDLMAGDKENLLLGECKWNNQDISPVVLTDLLTQGDMFPQKNKYFYIFAKRNFSQTLEEQAKAMDNVYLYSLKDMALR